MSDLLASLPAAEARRSGVAVTCYLFDLLYLEGYALERLPLRRCKALLEAALAFHAPLRLAPHRNRDGEACCAAACRKGWEGIIAKRADSPYRLARARSPFANPVKEPGVTWVAPEPVGEFRFTEWTREGKLRHSRFLGLRRDMPPEEVVREARYG